MFDDTKRGIQKP